MSTEKKTFTGGCHCGFIKYKFTPTPDPKTGKLAANRCNCTFCQKLHTTNFHLKEGPSAFELLSPSSRAEIPTYAPRMKTAARYFCAQCACHVWMEGYYEHNGNKVDLFAINLATVDQPQEGIDLSEVTITYFDMLHDNYQGGLRDSPWPCGLI